MDDHVATDLAPVESVIHDLEDGDEFEGDDVENEDIEGVVAAIDHETPDDAVVTVEP